MPPRLPPAPTPDAPDSEWKAYEERINAIQRQENPGASAVALSNYQARVEFRKKLDEDQKVYQQKLDEFLAERRAYTDQKVRESREALHKAGIDPDHPPDPPLGNPTRQNR